MPLTTNKVYFTYKITGLYHGPLRINAVFCDIGLTGSSPHMYAYVRISPTPSPQKVAMPKMKSWFCMFIIVKSAAAG